MTDLHTAPQTMVLLHGVFGDEKTIIDHARVSVRRQADETTALLSERDRGLLRRLLADRHGSPFEAVVFRFEVFAPIAVAREWFRHRIGSFNEVSLRYVEADGRFYLPATFRQQVGKAMDYQFVPLDAEASQRAADCWLQALDHAWAAYQALLRLGVAREQARFVLPLATMTHFFWVVNLRSLFNFLVLRLDQHAMAEIREAAHQVHELAAAALPEAFALWEELGRPRP